MFGYKLIIPADANQTDRVIRYVATTPGNFVVAMGRSKIPVLIHEDGNLMYPTTYRFAYGKSDWLREGSDATIVTCGTMVHKAIEVFDNLRENGINVGVLSITCPKELDREEIIKAAHTGLIVTYEDHHIQTGLGSHVGAFLSENSLNCDFIRLGVSGYGKSSSPSILYKIQGLDTHSLVDVIRENQKNKNIQS